MFLLFQQITLSNFRIFLLVLTLSITSCTEEKKVSYLHISHTRIDGGANRAMKEVEALDFSPYDMLWLGGDMALHSSKDSATLEYLDTIFQLSSPNTLWALGNHDYHTKPDLIKDFTKRPRYFSQYKNGITFFVHDTQIEKCNTSGDQLALLKSVTDTLKHSSHFIFLHHKLIWLPNHPELGPKANEITNSSVNTCFHCLHPNNFYEEVYPLLKEVQKRGIQVICVAGDIGFKVKNFEYKTKEGIIYLASGLWDKTPNQDVLLFEHDIYSKKLKWTFLSIQELLNKE